MAKVTIETKPNDDERYMTVRLSVDGEFYRSYPATVGNVAKVRNMLIDLWANAPEVTEVTASPIEYPASYRRAR
jgi:hypothetical protein